MPHVTSHGIDIHYEVTGSGQPLVLLHSFFCSGEMWRHQVPALAPQYQVINVDLRGHGNSGPIPGSFTLAEMVDDALAVLDDLGVERAVWMGLSIGGMISLRAALHHPERVAALILLDTTAGQETAWGRTKYRAMSVMAGMFGLRPLSGQIVNKMFGPTACREQPALVGEWSQRFQAMHVPSMRRNLAVLLARKDLIPQLYRIEVPALVLVGAEDRSLPPELSHALSQALPDARFQVLARAGHLSVLESPDAVNSVVHSFLQDLHL